MASEKKEKSRITGEQLLASAWQYDEMTDEYYLHLFSKTARFKLG